MAYATPYTPDAVGATITVSAEGTGGADTRTITIQFTDAAGANMDAIVRGELIVLLNAAGDSFVVTGGSTGIAQGASGKVLATVAKKVFKYISTTAGLLVVTWLDTGTEVAFLGVVLPNGEIVISSALTNA